jgi:hypothetical protein
MDIEVHVSDAEFLIASNRLLSALSLLLLAVAGASKRAYPSAPNDRTRFTAFIGGRLRRILFGASLERDELNPSSGIEVTVKNHRNFQDNMDVSEILYHLFRCPLVHESELPEHVEFLEEPPGKAGVSIRTGNRFCLGSGILPLLIDAVRGADCTADIYGRKLYGLRILGATDEDEYSKNICAEMTAKQSSWAMAVSPGRYVIMKKALIAIEPRRADALSNEELVDEFRRVLQAGALHSGAQSGLATAELVDRGGTLTALGLEMLRRMATGYEKVEVPFVPQ